MVCYPMTALAKAELVLGMTATRDYESGALTIGLGVYVRAIIERYGMLERNAVHTPGSGPEISTEQPEEKLLDAAGAVLYRQIVESLQYLAQVTRPDICYAVN